MVTAFGSPARTPLGGRRRRFLALMVGAPGPLAPTPSGGPLSMFLSVNGGHFWTSNFGTSRGPAVDCRVKFKITERGVEELASPVSS
jgi:hypothetical protein